MSSRLLVTATQAAEMLGIGERTFHELRHLPNFPRPVLLGVRCTRWRTQEIAAFVEALPGADSRPEPAQLLAKRGRSARREDEGGIA